MSPLTRRSMLLWSLGGLASAGTALAQLRPELERLYACISSPKPSGDWAYTPAHLECFESELQDLGIPLSFQKVTGLKALDFLDDKSNDGQTHFIVGLIEDAFQLVEGLLITPHSADEILAKAAKTKGEVWLKSEFLSAKRYMMQERPPDRTEVLDGIEVEVRELDLSDFDNMEEVPLSSTPVGDWPEDVTANNGVAALWDFWEERPIQEVWVATLEREDWTETPAFLRYGNWNACPPAHVHVAVLRYWRRKYGIRLASAKFDTLEFSVARPPSTRSAALNLAREQYAYCNDIVDQGTGDLATLAASLMESSYWYFWWD